MSLALKNCWTIAEATSQANPQPHQRLLNAMNPELAADMVHQAIREGLPIG